METILVKAAGLALVILLGYALKRLGVFHTEDAKIVSRIIIHVTLPAALLNGFRSFQFNVSYLALIAIAAGANLLLMALGLWLSRGKDTATQALYSMNVSSYNIGCFAMPFVQSFLPAEALVAVSMFDAGNCPFNAGISYAVVSARGHGERIHPKFVMDKLLHSVPFMSFFILMVMALLDLRLPDWVYSMTSSIGNANTFLAMLMIGILFEVHIEQEDRRQIIQILTVRYGCNLVLAVLIWLLPLPTFIRQVAVLAIFSPIPSVAMVYCEKCGCKPSSYGVLNSLSLVISLLLIFPLMLLMQL